MGIPFQVLPDFQEGADQALLTAKQHMTNARGPYCLLVKRQTFLPFKLKKPEPKFETKYILKFLFCFSQLFYDLEKNLRGKTRTKTK